MYSRVEYTYDSSGNPDKRFALTFDYLAGSDIKVYVNDVELDSGDDEFEFYSSTTVQINTSLTNGDDILIKRVTGITDPEVTFVSGGMLTAEDMNTMALQLLYGLQELADRVTDLEA